MKPLPHNLEAEQAVLGAILLRNESILEIDLQPDDYYNTLNQRIYRTMQDLWREKTAIDLVTIGNNLTRPEQKYLNSIIDSVSTSAGIKHHAEIVKKLSQRRKLIRASELIKDHAYNLTADINEIMSINKQLLREIDTGKDLNIDYFDNSKIAGEVYDEASHIQELKAYYTGIEPIDKKYYLEPQTTTILAAESGVGKSAFALQIAHFVAANNKVIYFSLESTRKALIRRMQARLAKVPLSAIKKGRVEKPEQLESLMNSTDTIFNHRNIAIIDDQRYSTLENLISYCETKAMDFPIALVVVDHLELLDTLKSYNDDPLGKVAYITRQFNNLAKSLNCHVIYITPLRKDVKGKPSLDDIKGSNSIRYNADNIMFLWTPDSYPTVYQVECFLAKGKDVELFSEWLEFDGNFQTFSPGYKPEIKKPKQKDKDQWWSNI